MKRFALLLFIAASARAQVIATAGPNIVVAHDARVELFDAKLNRLWSAEGVAQPSRVVVGSDRVAVLDAFASEARVLDLANGHGQPVHTAETPIDGAFIGHDLYLVDRDANRVERAGGVSVNVANDPAFMRVANNMLYVYSRVDGVVQEIAPATMRITRSVTIGPFASDFEADARNGYLVYPADAKLRTFSLKEMKRGSDIDAGAVPVDLAIASKANALSATRLAIADPSAKRVWIVEGSQSVAAAFTRGFIRGLLGLGLFQSNRSDFPSGVDRVLTHGSITVAYDTTTRTLYRLKGSKGSVIARDVAPGGFALTDQGVAVWQNSELKLIH